MMGKVHDPAPSRADDEVIDKAWVFVREYLNVSPDALFDALRKSLEDTRSFKVWKVDDDARYIDATTHSIRLKAKIKYHQVQVDAVVLDGKDASSSVLNIRITPTLVGIFSLYDIFMNVEVNGEFAEYVANLIFEAVELKV
jgi:hypothetical protein